MKVCIVGPVTPFRSGIARHTTALAQELARRPGIEVTAFSFVRQYPKKLYPGEHQTDAALTTPAEIETLCALDSLDPRTWRRTAQIVIARAPELVVIPAWTFVLAPCLGAVARILRRAGVPVVMIVHNAEDHEAARWKRALSRWQLRQADRLLTHNAAIAGELAVLVPETPVETRPHPVYNIYPPARGLLQRRAALELLFFGLIRPYKGLDLALRALGASGVEDVQFTIAGELWSGRAEVENLVADLGLSERIELVPRYVTDLEAAEYFARSDAVLAPYRSATGSGVVALAQWYCRPVVASDVPGLAESVKPGVTGWRFPPEDVEALAGVLGSITHETSAAMRPAIQAERDSLTWEGFADQLLSSESAR